jgi:ATP-binding protein involved in chromosome partitioning
VPFLGEIPLLLAIRELADAGTPIVLARPDSAEAKAYRDIARQVSASVTGAKAPAGPKIVVE